MANIKLTKENGTIKINSPYNSKFVQEVKTIGGRWDGRNKVWSVEDSEAVETRLKEILADVYGWVEDFTSLLTVQYNAQDFYDTRRGHDDIRIGNTIMVSRRSRDSMVDYYNTIVLAGGFTPAGGSAKYPDVNPDANTVLQSTIPQVVYDSLPEKDKNNLTLIEKTLTKEQLIEKRDKLVAEHETLAAKIAELEKEINNHK